MDSFGVILAFFGLATFFATIERTKGFTQTDDEGLALGALGIGLALSGMIWATIY